MCRQCPGIVGEPYKAKILFAPFGKFDVTCTKVGGLNSNVVSVVLVAVVVDVVFVS
jgi:hypothetical protein